MIFTHITIIASAQVLKEKCEDNVEMVNALVEEGFTCEQIVEATNWFNILHN